MLSNKIYGFQLFVNINDHVCCKTWFNLVDFFDPGVKKEEIKEEKPKTMADILPEGFFDNPKADAKVWMCLSISLLI